MIRLVPGGGFEPDRGVARRDPHEFWTHGALSGSQSRGSLLLRGLRPLGRAAHNAALSPPTTRGRNFSLALPLPWGFNTPTPRKWERTQTTSPFPFPWCREGDLNPHGNPIRPSSVRVCQFRHPGTGCRDHYMTIKKGAARREPLTLPSPQRGEGSEVGPSRPSATA